jgi:chaperonin cofactor prefoldin
MFESPQPPPRGNRVPVWIVLALIFAVGALAYDGLRRQRMVTRLESDLQTLRTEMQTLQEQARDRDKRAEEAKDRAVNSIAD